MTFCVGWRDLENIYIFSDSAVTITEKKDIEIQNYSSFYEREIFNNNYSVKEESIKIFKIGKIAIGFAGMVYPAREIAKIIKDNIKCFGVKKDGIINCIKSFLGEDKSISVSFIIGYFDIEPKLLYIKIISGVIDTLEENKEIIAIGSLDEERTKKVCEYIIGLNSVPIGMMEKLVSSVVFLQTFALDYLMPMGIGGVYKGIIVTKENTFWQKDLTYIFFSKDALENDPNGLTNNIVRVIIINNTVCVESYLSKDKRYFTDVINHSEKTFRNEVRIKNYKADIKASFSNKLRKTLSDYFIFIDIISKKAVIISMKNSEKYLVVKRIDGHKVNVKIRENLFQLLLANCEYQKEVIFLE